MHARYQDEEDRLYIEPMAKWAKVKHCKELGVRDESTQGKNFALLCPQTLSIIKANYNVLKVVMDSCQESKTNNHIPVVKLDTLEQRHLKRQI